MRKKCISSGEGKRSGCYKGILTQVFFHRHATSRKPKYRIVSLEDADGMIVEGDSLIKNITYFYK